MTESAIHTYEIEQDLRVGYYKDSYWRFFRDAWKVIEPHRTLEENWHMPVLCEELELVLHQVKDGKAREKDLIINIPPSTLKSSIATVAFPPWCWIWAPNLKFLSISHDADLAIRHAVQSRDIIRSDWYQKHFGHIFKLKYDVNKKSEYQNDKGGARIASGLAGGFLGKHGDIILLDDGNTPQKAVSQVEIQKANNTWDQGVSTRETDPRVTVKINIQQRLAINDLTGHMLSQDPNGYRHICLPAEKSDLISPPELAAKYDENDGLLSPKRLSRKELAKKRLIHGKLGYAGQYKQQPMDEEGALLNPKYITPWTMKRLEDLAFEEDQDIIWNMWVDGAYTEDKTNDPTGILIGAKMGNKLFIRYAAQEWMELPQLIKEIKALADQHDFGKESRVFVEPKASGLSAAQMLRTHSKLNIIIDKPPRDDKTVRFKSCLPFVEGYRLVVLDGAHWTTMYIDELKTFPFSEHDDLADCTSMAISWAQEDVESDSIIGIQTI